MYSDYNNPECFMAKNYLFSPLTLLPNIRKLTLTKLIIDALK